MKNIVVTMSGGTTQVINSTLVGIITAVQRLYPNCNIIAPLPGIRGIIDGKWRIFDTLSHKELESLKHYPGSSITGTCRITKDEVQSNLDLIRNFIETEEITHWFNIGGSGTIKQSKWLSSLLPEVQFIALPKTIDNDFGDSEFKTLSYTPGYLSAKRYLQSHVYNLIRENEGAYVNDRVIISQIFGRDTGFLTALTDVGDKRQLLLFPEKPLSTNELLNAVKERIDSCGGCVITVAEGYKSNMLSGKLYDESNQVMFGSTSVNISDVLKDILNTAGYQSRICNTTIEQRQNTYSLDLGDISVAFRLGYEAVKYCTRNTDDVFMSYNGTVNPIPIDRIPENWDRKMPVDWISECGTRTSSKFKDYINSITYMDYSIPGTSYINPTHLFK